MTGITKGLTKGLVLTAATGAMALATAAPAQAQYRGDRGYGRGGGDPVEQCISAAERSASRVGRAQVTEVINVNRVRQGTRVYGRIAVDQDYRDRHDRWDNDDRYDRRGGRDYSDDRYDRRRGRDDRYGHGYGRGNDHRSGNFSCVVSYGRIADLSFSGIRGLG